MHTRHETAKYALTGDRFGFYTLIRKADNATAFFQGEDAALWDNNMNALEKIETEGKWCAGNSLDQSFDFLCDGYAEVLQSRES